MYIVYNRIFGAFPAKNSVCTPYIHGSGQPYSFICHHAPGWEADRFNVHVTGVSWEQMLEGGAMLALLLIAVAVLLLWPAD